MDLPDNEQFLHMFSDSKMSESAEDSSRHIDMDDIRKELSTAVSDVLETHGLSAGQIARIFSHME